MKKVLFTMLILGASLLANDCSAQKKDMDKIGSTASNPIMLQAKVTAYLNCVTQERVQVKSKMQSNYTFMYSTPKIDKM